MSLSRSTITFICVLLLLSIIVATFLNSIATDHNFYLDSKAQEENHTRYLGRKYGQITDDPKNVVWFLQISDIHLSIFRDPGRISQFQQFCDVTVKIVKPMLVLASGDLTDAKAKDNLGSSQVKMEWVYYQNIIKESGVTDHTLWLDIRGNHDNFNIKTIDAEENFYRNFSVQGTQHQRSYVNIQEKNGVRIAFLGVDACPEPGIRRPFNFIGILDEGEQENLRRLKSEAIAQADQIIWFGHYPTSCILPLVINKQRMSLRDEIGDNAKTLAYLCGHLHSMGGFVPRMYTKQKRGYLELELADWKDSRMMRLMAVDHGLFSFVDQKHNTWPLVLVTNPKHAQYIMPGREPLELIEGSTHIRILAFSNVDIVDVKISFDKNNWQECLRREGPLYVCEWSPHLFAEGLHRLFVTVTDEMDKEVTIDHLFSLDGSVLGFEVNPRILLMLDATTIFQGIFATLLLATILPLVLLRFQKRPPKYHRRCGSNVLRRLWLLSKIDRIYYPLILYTIYLPFGPWAIGELIDDHIGIVFAWGIVVKGTYIPEAFTYMYGSVQLMFVQIPLFFVLAHSLTTKLFCQNIKGIRRLFSNLPFIFLLSIQLLLAYFFWLEYGTMAFVFGPLRTWSIPLNIILWYKTWNLPLDHCRKLRSLNDL
ncbi:transmembrane protein 62-like isoform X1 [Amyelois transitella]|uniref:transmembrane protein 62-like isoform X1 n=1 Tax=Amyelois transitella TaxID=680683 RepID=UPI00067B0474|nr:transmembrane protein 62-like isoform X1 [Amyelois transitella]